MALTVHGIQIPDVRRSGGRLKMLLVLAFCASPVIASYLTYFLIKPEGRTNYAELITPPRSIPQQLALQSVSGQAIDPASLKGQWIIAVVAGGACSEQCETNLLIQRQLRETLGREKDRVDKVWFLVDQATPSEAVVRSVSSGAATQIYRVSREQLAQWLQPSGGHALEDHLYVIDPMAHWMMRAPVISNPSGDWAGLTKFKKDIERLLRASASWDQAGR